MTWVGGGEQEQITQEGRGDKQKQITWMEKGEGRGRGRGRGRGGGATANDMEGGSKSTGGGRGGMMTNNIGGGGGGGRARANEYTYKYLTGSTLVWYSSKQGTIYMGRLQSLHVRWWFCALCLFCGCRRHSRAVKACLPLLQLSSQGSASPLGVSCSEVGAKPSTWMDMWRLPCFNK